MSEKWPHKWFGIWKEMGPQYKWAPSVQDFVDQERLTLAVRRQLAEYLRTAHDVAATSAMSFPCVICGKRAAGSISYRTDGDWLWLDNLAHYVLEHGVFLPEQMVENFGRNRFIPPPVDPKAIEHMEFPKGTG